MIVGPFCQQNSICHTFWMLKGMLMTRISGHIYKPTGQTSATFGMVGLFPKVYQSDLLLL